VALASAVVSQNSQIQKDLAKTYKHRRNIATGKILQASFGSKGSKRMNDLAGVKTDKVLAQEAETQQAEAVDMLRRQANGEEFEERSGQLIFEVYSRQRRYFENALRMAEQQISGQHFPNENDRLAAREIIYVQHAAMGMCGVRGVGNTVEEMAKRCKEAEEQTRKQGKVIVDLENQVDELLTKMKTGGPGRGNKE
jgi:hypothetical protein